MKNNLKYLLLLVLLALISCKKKDTITHATIHGQVYNQCTDSGLANITVYIYENNNSIAQTTSGTNGNFTFTNVAIHSSSDYSYQVYIPAISGIGGAAGFQVNDVSFTSTNTSQFFVVDVVPSFGDLCFTSNITSPIISPDSFFVLFKQKKIATSSISPYVTYTLGTSSYHFIPSHSYCMGDYVMGLWNITIDKWKSGVHTTTNDSIYLSYGATKTYTLNW